MTRKELCDKYDISESTVKNAFPRLQKRFLEKHKLILTKTGRGDKADYQVSFSLDSDGRAITMRKEQKREFMLAKQEFSNLIDFNFMVFLGICMTPMTTFYGTYEDFLDYVEIGRTKLNLENLHTALTALKEMDYIKYDIDPTNENYFWAGLYFKTRQDMAISIDMMDRCKALADKYNKRSWVPLLKTWIGVQYVYDKQPFTMERLSQVTGLSPYQIRESRKVLEKDELFVTSKAYVSYDTCIGTNVELNGIYKENRDFVERSKS